MYDITKFTFEDMIRCGEALQNLELKAKNVEDLADLIVHYFHDNLIDKNTGEKSCALVRFFMTYPYSSLDEELRQITDRILHGQPAPEEMKCLVLLATAGLQPAWNSPKLSQGHRVLPLLNENILKQNLMVYEFRVIV